MPYGPTMPSVSSVSLDALIAALLVGAGAGALSIAHCAAMCGPLSAFGCSGGPEGRRSSLRAGLWLAGRTSSYAALGAAVGGASGALAHLLAAGPFESLISIVLGVALLVSGISFLRERPATVTLGRKKRVSLFQRVAGRLLALRSAPLLLGAMSGLLPCGALWAALASASATGSALTGAVAMITFSLVSAPGLVLAGVLSGMRDGIGRRLVGGMFVVGAVVLLLRPLTMEAEGPACHSPAPHAALDITALAPTGVAGVASPR